MRGPLACPPVARGRDMPQARHTLWAASCHGLPVSNQREPSILGTSHRGDGIEPPTAAPKRLESAVSAVRGTGIANATPHQARCRTGGKRRVFQRFVELSLQPSASQSQRFGTSATGGRSLGNQHLQGATERRPVALPAAERPLRYTLRPAGAMPVPRRWSGS